MPQSNPRKRPAPGSSPDPTQQLHQDYTAQAQTSTDQFLRWNQAAETPNYGNTYNMNSFSPNIPSGSQFQPALSATSTQLARRPVNQQVIPARTPFESTQDPWGPFGDESLIDGHNGIGMGMEETESVEFLEEKAIVAKRDAQSKRKQIPPFVQKLSSFLDESKNTELIRWSERGDSFVVLDEDEFAKTLIPELFKHNNYASFVRQLNMYGFHKRVGLSDNSMKASERKNKTPSEYYNPYFKRGHPNLLWLINKPKGGAGQKKTKGTARTKADEGGELDSDDEGRDGIEEIYSSYGNIQGNQRAISNTLEPGPLQRREMAVVENQLQDIKKQQGAISNAISRLRKDHNQLYQQAVAFQTLHDRHESSINAILTFLATVYNRSLDGQGGQNIAQMFSNAIPQDQGSVVELNGQQQDDQGSLSPRRKSQRLLMPPPTSDSISPMLSPVTHGEQYQNSIPNPRHSAIEELFEASPAESASVKSELDRLPQQNMMNIINNTNAQVPRPGSKTMTFPDVLSHFENSNGRSPLTSEERNNMLHLIATTASTPGSNNALVSPTPPQPPILEQMGYTQQEIDELIRMQQEQQAKLSEVSAMIQPLSPSGTIPGLTDGYFADANVSPSAGGSVDLDQYLNAGAYYSHGDGTDFNYDNLNFGNADPSSFDFKLDGMGGGSDGTGDNSRIVEERASSEDYSPSGERVGVQDLGPGSPSKRRRKAQSGRHEIKHEWVKDNSLMR